MDYIIIDPRQSGISGDMLVAALTDFFDCHEFTNNFLLEICQTAKELFSIICNFRVKKDIKMNNISGSALVYTIDKDFESISVMELLDNWKAILNKMSISENVQERIFSTVDSLISTEKVVHGKENESLNKIHFHELNSIDTIIDISIISLIVDKFSSYTFYGLPVALGTGTITFSHGSFQQPAPAVANLLEGNQYPFLTVNASFELTTPTGLVNLVSLVRKDHVLQILPAGKILRSGIGLGKKQLKDFPNFLKIWMISNSDQYFEPEMLDSLLILETNLDDVSGEILGMVIESYGRIEGVKDVSIYPLIMKKNRPGHCLRILLDPEQTDISLISKKLIQDTGSLGIRYFPVSRHKTLRHITDHSFRFGNQNYRVRIKVSKFPDGKIVSIKPEYDDLLILSNQLSCPLRQLSQLIIESYKKENRGNFL